MIIVLAPVDKDLPFPQLLGHLRDHLVSMALGKYFSRLFGKLFGLIERYGGIEWT